MELHEILEKTLGSSNVYFQPPTKLMMKYPCIVYNRGEADARASYADNLLYRIKGAYTVTVIDADPDSLIPDKVQALLYARFNRHFTADNLNHDVFTLYY